MIRLSLHAIRLLGVAFLGFGIYLLWKGGEVHVLTLFGNSLPVPLHYLLILLGFAISLSPLLVLNLIVAILPEKRAVRLEKYVRSLSEDDLQIGQADDIETVARMFDRFRLRVHQRFYLTLLFSVVFLGLILPFLVLNLIKQSTFNQNKERLISLVQESPLQFFAVDRYRLAIIQAQPIMTQDIADGTATQRIYNLLRDIFDLSVSNQSQLNSQIKNTLESTLEIYDWNRHDLLDIDRQVDLSFKPGLETSQSVVSYLSLLGAFSNVVGDHGDDIWSYLRGRQLLEKALLLADTPKSQKQYPGLHNNLGVNYTGHLLAYGKYLGAHSGRGGELRALVDHDGPLTEIELVMLADDHYRKALEASTSRFSRGRFFNNYVDLRLYLLHKIHILDADLEVGTDTQREFLEHLRREDQLGSLLDNLKVDIEEAIDLGRDIRMYYTRAQLLSMGGEIAEKKGLNINFWSNAAEVREAAWNDLGYASEGVDCSNFTPGKMQHLYLGWLLRYQDDEDRIERVQAKCNGDDGDDSGEEGQADE